MSHSIKNKEEPEEVSDASQSQCQVKIEPNPSSSAENVEQSPARDDEIFDDETKPKPLKVKKKKRKASKRKAESPLDEKDIDVKNAKHECGVEALFGREKHESRALIKALPMAHSIKKEECDELDASDRASNYSNRSTEDVKQSSAQNDDDDETKQLKPLEVKNETDPNINECDKEKKKKARKRKASHTATKVGSKKCCIRTLFRADDQKGLIKALRKGWADSEQRASAKVKNKCSGVTCKITESSKCAEILNSPLSPLKLKSGSVELPECSEGYEWRNDVSNPIIEAVDRSIKQIATSILVDRDSFRRTLNILLADLNAAVKFEGFTNRWNWYGSYLTGCVCLDSSVDIVYECIPKKDTCASGKVAENIAEKMFQFLKADKNIGQVGISRWYDPPRRIKMRHKRRCIRQEIQINFSSDVVSCEMLVAKSLLMKFYLNLSQDLKHLFLIVRIILQKYVIHGSVHKFRSYTIFWLVVFFMQLKNLLPAVIDVRKAAEVKHYVAGWDCSLPETYSYATEPVSIYSLLLEFFDYYKNFNFSIYVICPFLGRVFPLSDLEQLRIPSEEFSLYLRQLNNPHQLTFVRGTMNLQDPSDLCYNVAERVHADIVAEFNVLCRYLSERLPNSVEQMKTMNCFCNIFISEHFRDYLLSDVFAQYAVLVFCTETLKFSEERRKKLNQMHVLEAIRKIMESIFSFEKKNIEICQNNTRVSYARNSGELSLVRETFPVIYFEYCSSNSTWENDYFNKIVRRKGDEEQIKIFLTCEIRLEKDFVKIFVQGDVDFVSFLNKHLLKMIKSMLEKLFLYDDIRLISLIISSFCSYSFVR